MRKMVKGQQIVMFTQNFVFMGLSQTLVPTKIVTLRYPIWSEYQLDLHVLPAIILVSFPAPNPLWWHWNSFLVVQALDLTAMLCNRLHASCTLLRNGMQNHRAALIGYSYWPCTTLLCNRMQYHMKIIELQSDWLTWKQECWACKNQENAQMSPDPFPRRGGLL